MEFWQINQFFGRLLAVDPNIITFLVLGICGVLAAFCYPSKDWSRRLRDIAPALMVSAGIIGTFWGTFIALTKFQTGGAGGALDHKAMVESIPAVLGGMKTAFVTTLIGLFSAFFLKFILRILPQREPPPLPNEQEAIDLLRQIKEGIIGEGDKSLSSQMSSLQAEYRDSTDSLKQSISGDNESSLASQLKKLRNENSDGFKKLDSRLDGLADAIRHSLVENMEALMKELRVVIVDQLASQLEQTNKLLREQLTAMLDRIEEALIKQFGETFKQFNEATQAIKKWQEDHRQHVEQLTEAFETTAAGIEKIRVDCESIPDTMKQLVNLMGELDQRLQAFADMKESAEQSFPVIKKHLDAIGADLEKSASGFTGLEETIRQIHKQAGDLAQQHIETAQQHIEQVGSQINRTAEQVASASEGMITESQKASDQHQQEIRGIVDAVHNASQLCIESTQNTLTKLAERQAATVKEMHERASELTQKHITSAQRHVEQIGNQINYTVEQVASASESMITESRNASIKYQEEIQEIVNVVKRESERCVENTQSALTQLAEQHAQTTNNTMAAIAERWGENVVGIAEKMAQAINDRRR